MSEKEFKTKRDYLNKTYLEELNFKLWVTKGARFTASSRLYRQAYLSNLSLTLVSCYLIFVSLVTVYQFNIPDNTLKTNMLGFTSIALSILILVLGQIENGKDYKLNAHLMHQCALEISVLYNKLRLFKTIESKPDDKKEKAAFCKEISKEYNDIISHYQNHTPIDYELFETQKPDFNELKKIDIFRIKVKYFIQVELVFYLYIIIPPIVFINIIFHQH